jgi:hypothetical protein
MSRRRPNGTSSMSFANSAGNATNATLGAAIGAEIDRLEREAATLRKLRSGLLDAAGPVGTSEQ